MIFVTIAKELAALAGFQSRVEGDRFIYWNDSDTFSTMITDNKISELQFRKNIEGRS